ncbi:transglutaminase-like domain-containing protein [Microlunatus soli]|uniref:Transglutaminase-like superfamily protein n=1 Tax=Microlunatus soli TaxID=630515 RepID=A0A1H1SDL1_9ACTN|nr:transglutaminase-like domain-containing protein [Microlunatus soli]SDS46067.1 Transglutaminase-like superfamily protein [Microlunatus soli]
MTEAQNLPGRRSDVSSPNGYDPRQWAVHTAYSDPGPYADLLLAVPAQIEKLSAVARNLIIHYRASGLKLPEETRDDIDARWIAAILDLDQQRHPQPLDVERDPISKVQGCCRDHSLFSVAVLRQHGVPARLRYGFAHYFHQDYGADHVIVEIWLSEEMRWLRFDPEVGEPMERLTTPQDIPHGPDAPFTTAAECWLAYRAGTIDPRTYGAGPGVGVGGAWYMQGAVFYDAAFRAGHELLVWDTWPGMSSPDGVTTAEARLADELSALIVAADSGDADAERQLIERMRSDPTVGPGTSVRTMSPRGDPARTTDLTRRPGTRGTRSTGRRQAQ